MRVKLAKRILQRRAAYLDAKIALGDGAHALNATERDALDLAMRMLGWHDAEVRAAYVAKAQIVALPAERRGAARLRAANFSLIQAGLIAAKALQEARVI